VSNGSDRNNAGHAQLPVDSIAVIAPENHRTQMIRGQRRRYCLLDDSDCKESLVDMENDSGEMRNSVYGLPNPEATGKRRRRPTGRSKISGDNDTSEYLGADSQRVEDTSERSFYPTSRQLTPTSPLVFFTSQTSDENIRLHRLGLKANGTVCQLILWPLLPSGCRQAK
jgi:hypothetical protein